MFEKLEASLPVLASRDLTFEMIQHRFTKPAKRVIQEKYLMTKLELDESKRKMKWGDTGYINMFIRISIRKQSKIR